MAHLGAKTQRLQTDKNGRKTRRLKDENLRVPSGDQIAGYVLVHHGRKRKDICESFTAQLTHVPEPLAHLDSFVEV